MQSTGRRRLAWPRPASVLTAHSAMIGCDQELVSVHFSMSDGVDVPPRVSVIACRVEWSPCRAPSGIECKCGRDATTTSNVARTCVRNPCIERPRELAHQQSTRVQALDGVIEVTAAVQGKPRLPRTSRMGDETRVRPERRAPATALQGIKERWPGGEPALADYAVQLKGERYEVLEVKRYEVRGIRSEVWNADDCRLPPVTESWRSAVLSVPLTCDL